MPFSSDYRASIAHSNALLSSRDAISFYQCSSGGIFERLLDTYKSISNQVSLAKSTNLPCKRCKRSDNNSLETVKKVQVLRDPPPPPLSEPIQGER